MVPFLQTSLHKKYIVFCIFYSVKKNCEVFDLQFQVLEIVIKMNMLIWISLIFEVYEHRSGFDLNLIFSPDGSFLCWNLTRWTIVSCLVLKELTTTLIESD